jgi:DNA-binding NtrC family response regulator
MAARILLVDDENAVHFAMRDYMSQRGYAVDGARSAAEALGLLARSAYQVVIADLRLSEGRGARAELEGLDLIEDIRSRRPAARVLVLTGCAQELEAEARRRGADGFMQKPQPLARVAEMVERLCRGER